MSPSSGRLIFVTTTLICCTLSSAARAQSGRATFTGWVAFDGVAYVDKQPTAKIELFRSTDTTKPVLTASTDDHGHYKLDTPSLGEMILRISAPGFTTYEIPVYIPSDSTCNLDTLLKKAAAPAPASQK